MNEKDVEYFMSNFTSGSDFESFYFIERSELDKLYEEYISRLNRACCSRRKRVNLKYRDIIKNKFENYSE